MSQARVVVTGLGILSPLGNDLQSSWDGIVNGRSGIGPITHFDATGYATRIAGEVRDFDAKTPPGVFAALRKADGDTEAAVQIVERHAEEPARTIVFVEHVMRAVLADVERGVVIDRDARFRQFDAHRLRVHPRRRDGR